MSIKRSFAPDLINLHDQHGQYIDTKKESLTEKKGEQEQKIKKERAAKLTQTATAMLHFNVLIKHQHSQTNFSHLKKC